MTNGNFVAFNDDWNSPLTPRVFEEFLKVLGVLLCVAVVNGVSLLGVVLTGRLSVRSASLTVNDHDFLRHLNFPP